MTAYWKRGYNTSNQYNPQQNSVERQQSVRRALALAASLGLLFSVACSDSSGPSTPYAGGWSGTTSQGQPIRFLVEENTVTVILARWVVDGATCTRSGETLYALLGSDVPRVIANKTFSYTQVGTDVDFDLNGSFSTETAASGTITVTSAVCDGLSDITWSATRTKSPAVNVSGTWDGRLQSNVDNDTPIVLLFVQSGAELQGTIQRQAGNGTIEGELVERLLSFTVTQTAPECSGTFRVRGAVLRTEPTSTLPPADSIAFGYSGNDCAGSHRGTGYALRR